MSAQLALEAAQDLLTAFLSHQTITSNRFKSVLAKINTALAAHEAEQALVALTAEQQRLGLYDEAAPQEPDKLDAERYRAIRDGKCGNWALCEWGEGDGCEEYVADRREPHIVDAAIDKARKAQP